MLDAAAVERQVASTWDGEIVPILHDYIRIPAKSPAYDERWAENGHIDAAVELLRGWAERRPIDGMSVEVVRLRGRTPVLLCEIPPTVDTGTASGTVLLYGHLDKQPEMVGWDDGKGPWEPVLDAGRLYGRGGADDGYAMFASLAAVEAVHESGGSHARLVVLIEASEESGSPDLPAHVDHLAERLGPVDLVVCLDSSCGTYDTLWVTTSLRGLVGGVLSVDVVREGLHSGAFGGVVPSSFRIARQLLSRVEDDATGGIRLDELHVPIPDERRRQIADVAAELGTGILDEVPWAGSTRPGRDDVAEILLDKTWRPALTVTGFDGAPPPADAGNVIVPGTRLAVSVRIPPTCDDTTAGEALKAALEADPPQGAEVRFELGHTAAGWAAPATAPWLATALDAASRAAFGRPARYQGEGGSIPFMGMLGERFPQAQFVVTGVLGPGSNAHGPNEFLDVAMGRGVTSAVAHLLDAHVTEGAPATSG
jgi:acetylornithine deacetylase/succinyl-diaminopimelate desuccinylase-like protein